MCVTTYTRGLSGNYIHGMKFRWEKLIYTHTFIKRTLQDVIVNSGGLALMRAQNYTHEGILGCSNDIPARCVRAVCFCMCALYKCLCLFLCARLCVWNEMGRNFEKSQSPSIEWAKNETGTRTIYE